MDHRRRPGKIPTTSVRRWISLLLASGAPPLRGTVDERDHQPILTLPLALHTLRPDHWLLLVPCC